MAETTAISWTDHTFNPWWGCTKIAPGCDNCYAAALDKRTGGNFWDEKPRITSQQNWNKVLKWNEQATKENKRHKVFCGSMMDWCDKNAPACARSDLFELIKDTPMLDWQLLTKRASLIEKSLPEDWGNGYDNVWLGVTCEDVRYGLNRLVYLRDIPAKVKFLSCEPLLEDISFLHLGWIDWVIIGGESGPGCRLMRACWAEALIHACEIQDVPVWFKQWGGNTKNKGGCVICGEEFKQWPRNNYEQ